MRRLPFLSIILFLALPVFSPTGGRHAYEFLNLVSSPRVAALGGKYLSCVDNDLSLVYHNPSLLNDLMDHTISLSFVNYYAGIKYGNVAYANKLRKNKTYSIGLQYINYGKFT